MPRAPVVVLVAGVPLLACADPSSTLLSRFEPSAADGPLRAAAVPLGSPLPGLSSRERERFERGLAVFTRDFEPSSGLGPLFNAEACGECHEDPAVGGVGDEVEVHASWVRPDGACDLLAAEGGMVIQQHATPELTAAMAKLGVPDYLAESTPEDGTLGRRSTPPVFGLGLLDGVPEATIRALADPNDANRDGISGRPNYTADGRIGRFGRKATEPTLREFNADAALNEMGITNRLFPVESSIGGYPIPEGVDLVPVEPELSARDFDDLDAFLRYLAPPPPVRLTRAATDGQRLFSAIGCAACHVPSLRTGPSAVRALSNHVVNAFTDLLLHDMGPGLADICVRQASPTEFRTEPLMGLRFRAAFLHDGRAATVEAAVLAHGGEATRARDRFAALAAGQKAALVAYLKSL